MRVGANDTVGERVTLDLVGDVIDLTDGGTSDRSHDSNIREAATTGLQLDLAPTSAAGVRAGFVAKARAPRWQRPFDLVLGTLLFLVALVILPIVALAVLVIDGRPVFIRNSRFGWGGTKMSIFKVRTMISPDAQVACLSAHPELAEELRLRGKIRNDPRVTRLGRLLRRTSIDELPQVLNVLRGEMSMVGPRPKLLTDRHHYGDAFDTIVSVRPGLTGLWQVSGRSDLEFDETILLDLRDVRQRSFGRDLAICVRTVAQFLSPKRHGAY